MIEIGKVQSLTIVKTTSFGVYLAEDNNPSSDRILLPIKQVPQGAKPGDKLEVFTYLDSKDRPIATTRSPRLTLGQVAVLPVKQVTRIGAFLDWGLEKDLLLPFHEQTTRVEEGQECLVALYLDKSSRLCATMKVYHYLSTHSPYAIQDEVTGRVYEISGNFGIFVAVDDRYSALIPKAEAQGRFAVGDILHLRVTQVKEDGKLTVSNRQKAYLQMDEDALQIMSLLDRQGGTLPFDDKASPEMIKEAVGLSKNAFKRAVGRLLKGGKVAIQGGRIVKL